MSCAISRSSTYTGCLHFTLYTPHTLHRMPTLSYTIHYYILCVLLLCVLLLCVLLCVCCCLCRIVICVLTAVCTQVARRISGCPQHHFDWHLHAGDFFHHPLVRSIWKDGSINADIQAHENELARRPHTTGPPQGLLVAPPQQTPPPPRTALQSNFVTAPDCVRDCLGVDITEDRRPNRWRPDTPLIDYAAEKPSAAHSPSACRHACACFARAALGDGSEGALAAARIELMAWRHRNS